MALETRTHNRKTFFKYTSAATARVILERGALRWSSPVLFNDPFDVPRELAFGVGSVDISKALGQRIAQLIATPPEDTSVLSVSARRIVEKAQAVRLSGTLPELIETASALYDPLEVTGEGMTELRSQWRAWVPKLRILCLTESPAHIAMWYHYADKYRGAVLEVQCVDKYDSAWFAARKVMYPATKPAIYTADGWATLLTKENELATRELIMAGIFTKAQDWSYENEWRLMALSEGPGYYTDHDFHPPELAGLYIGPDTAARDRQQLLRLVAGYPDARVVDVAIGMDRDLHFAPVDG